MSLSLLFRFFSAKAIMIKTTAKKNKIKNTKNGCSVAASDLFHMFTQSTKFFTFHYHILKSTDA